MALPIGTVERETAGHETTATDRPTRAAQDAADATTCLATIRSTKSTATAPTLLQTGLVGTSDAPAQLI
jgi:hypothetical protein